MGGLIFFAVAVVIGAAIGIATAFLAHWHTNRRVSLPARIAPYGRQKGRR